MAKKGLFALIFTVFIVVGVFAQSPFNFSLGAGILSDFDRGGVFDNEVDFVGRENLGFGGWAFADATFAEISIGFFGGPHWLVVRDDGDRGNLWSTRIVFSYDYKSIR